MQEICIRSRNALAILLAVALLAGLALVVGVAPVAAAGTSISITPSAQTVNAGDTFTVSVDINSDQAIGGAQCAVLWSPAANIQCTTVAKGVTFVAAGASWIPATISIDNAAGRVPNATDGAASATIIGGSLTAGTHTFFTLTFQAISDGLVNLTIADAIVLDATYLEIPGLTLNNGAVQVGQQAAVDYVVLSKSEAPLQGDNYTITCTIQNQGSLDATEACLTYVYIDDMVNPVAMISCPALAAGDTDTQTISPFTLSGGTDTIRVCADGSDVIVEGNEGNNCLTNQYPASSSATVTVVPSAGTVAVGQAFDVAIRVSMTSGASRGAQCVLGWELPEKASCSNGQAGGFYTDPYFIPGAIDNPNGVVALTAVMATPPAPCATGTGDFLVYHFQALEAGVVQFSLSDVIVMDCNGEEIPGVTVIGGQVVITATCSTELAGNPIATIVIDCPDPKTDLAFRIGRNIYTDVLNIRCNDVWRCDVSDQDPATAGRMTEWDGTAYVAGGSKLDSKMQVRCTPEGTLVTLPTSGKIADGDTLDQSGNSGQNFTIEFIQDTEFDDPVLHGGHVYHIVATFTAYITA